MLVVVHTFLDQSAVHVLLVPHGPLGLDLTQPALLAGRFASNHLVERLHLLDVFARRVPRPVSYDGGQVDAATLFGRRLQDGGVHGENVLYEMRVHFLVPPFGAEVFGDGWYVWIVPGVCVVSEAAAKARCDGQMKESDFPESDRHGADR